MTARPRWTRVTATLGLVLGCSSPAGQGLAPSPSPVPGPGAAPAALTLPGTYATPVRCEGTAQTDIALTLYAEGLYVLRRTERDSACATEVALLYIGRWTVSSGDRAVTLLGAVPSPRRFLIADSRTLLIREEGALEARDSQPPHHGAGLRLVPFRRPFDFRGLTPAEAAAGT